MDDVDLLIRRVRSGEVEAYAEIVRRFERPVWRVVAAMLQDFEQSRELMQQVFVQAYLRLDQYQLGRDFEAWIKAVARNQVRQELRRLGRESRRMLAYREQLEQRLADEAAGERYGAAYLEALSECRGKLPERSARALGWRYEEGLSFEGIAERLDMTRAAAEKLLSRVRQSLRDCIEACVAENGRGIVNP